MQHDSQFDASWPVALAFGLMGILTLSLTNTGHTLRGEVFSWANSARTPVVAPIPARPQVLVVTNNRDDQTQVAFAVNPRGYHVVVAETADSGSQILHSDATRIGVVVLDTQLPGAETIAALARSLVPDAKLINLAPNHAITDLSKLLSDAI
jgi:CheY-like chemotaxis protein